MIYTYTAPDGICVLGLQRCNVFDDHKNTGLKGKDGDILFQLCGNGHIDAHDAKILVERIVKRLNIDELEEQAEIEYQKKIEA